MTGQVDKNHAGLRRRLGKNTVAFEDLEHGHPVWLLATHAGIVVGYNGQDDLYKVELVARNHWGHGRSRQDSAVHSQALGRKCARPPASALPAARGSPAAPRSTRYWFTADEIEIAGIDVNEATADELEAAICDPPVSRALLDAATDHPFRDTDDALLRAHGLQAHHIATMLRYEPPVFIQRAHSEDEKFSYTPRVKDLLSLQEHVLAPEEAKLQQIRYDRQIEFDPFSNFYAYCRRTHAWYWFYLQVRRPSLLRLLRRRGYRPRRLR
jgi:hypothetical protein